MVDCKLCQICFRFLPRLFPTFILCRRYRPDTTSP